MVLHEVVPDAPFPYDVGSPHGVGLELDQLVAPELAPVEQARVTSIFDAFQAVNDLPADGDDVALRCDGEVVVEAHAVVVGREAPEDLIVPRPTLDGGTTTARPDWVIAHGCGPGGHDDVPVGLQVGRIAGPAIGIDGPVVHHLTTGVEQHGAVLVVGVDHRVPFRIEVGIVSDGTNGILGRHIQGGCKGEQDGQDRKAVVHGRGLIRVQFGQEWMRIRRGFPSGRPSVLKS